MKPAWDRLPAFDDDGNVLAVVEAAADSRCKFKYAPQWGVFVLHSVLPTGTAFPYAFGFVPSTLGEDGDALDIVVLTDEPPPVATLVPCRIVANLKAHQMQGKQRIRNDRLLGVAACSERYAQSRHRKDIEQTVLDRIADFFAFYHREQGKTFEPDGWMGRKAALAALNAGRRAFRRRHAGRS